MTIRLANYVLILMIGLSGIGCSDQMGVPVLIWSTQRSVSLHDLLDDNCVIYQ